MRRLAGYPRGFYHLLTSTFLVLTASGLLLVPTMATMRLALDTPLQINSGLRLGSATLHCGAAFLIMTLVGALTSVHVRAGWHRRQHRFSGTSLLATLVLLAGSALGIFYAGDENLSFWSSLLHTLAGLLLITCSIVHATRGHRTHTRRHPPH